ncbi:hypothetical protein [Deinococcus hopiensis]|uniref:hypothetical protein n=1 Tax=Deinococcus hopiensis TaxID=309885 RepID=UPI0009FE4F5E
MQQCQTHWRHAVETGEPYEVEYRFRRAADNTYRWRPPAQERGGRDRQVDWHVHRHSRSEAGASRCG